MKKEKCIKVKKPFPHYVYRGYQIINHGYYPPDRCIWWEGVDLKTNCADFHYHTKRDVKDAIDDYLNNK